MNETERIAKVETTVENIERGLSRMEKKLDDLFEAIDKRYVPRSENQAQLQRLEEKIEEQERRIHELTEKQGKVPQWATMTISILMTVLAALLGIHYSGH